MNDRDQRPTQPQSFLSGFEDWGHMWRFCCAIAAVLFALALSAGAALKLFGISIATQQLTISASGETQGKITGIDISTAGLSFQTNDNRSTHIVFVPANVLWIDTAIDVPNGAELRLTAQGSMTLSNRLVDRQTEEPHNVPLDSFNFLVDPSGQSVNARDISERAADRLRKDLRVMSGVRLGTLLAAVAPAASSSAPSKRNPRPAENMVSIGRGPVKFRYADRNERDGRLFLTINDLIAENTPDARDTWLLGKAANRADAIKDAYPAPDYTDEKVAAAVDLLTKRWTAAVENNYPEIFFEDNSGFFIVIVEICKTKCA